MNDSGIETVAVIGTGLIGSAWTTLFLAHGLKVIAVDPDPDAPGRLRQTIESMAAHLREADLIAHDAEIDTDRVRHVSSPGPELAAARFVQENAPERLELKRELFARLDELTEPDTILASSTTALRVSDIQTACRHPERVIAGHPLNPPHLIPLVEISGGELTDPAALERAAAFYRSIGKVPVCLRRDIEGHIAGRLSAALWREAVHLVEQGIASVEDIDAAVVNGPGLRWAAVGPHMTYHLGGGPGGIADYLEHLGASQERRWASLGTPQLTDEVKRQISDGLNTAANGLSVEALEAERDRSIVSVLRTQRHRPPPQSKRERQVAM
ncbi:MAG: 3-hydroxyacyl-CoA dehydrogenase NAD-binding domain-containing protein [Hyphomicrobiales bacterium]|nr:3-hydroxyacyl-CoA dehydrogenase NAD-binding domain-containing protein [Hyphomicrobiales bacterium]